MHGTWGVKNPKGKIERVRPQDTSHTATPSKASSMTFRAPVSPKQPQTLHGTQAGSARPLRSQGRRFLRHLQRSPLAREGLSRAACVHSGAPKGRRLPVKGAEQPKQASTRAVAPVKVQAREASAPAKVAKKAAPRKPVADKAAVETAAAPSVVKTQTGGQEACRARKASHCGVKPPGHGRKKGLRPLSNGPHERTHPHRCRPAPDPVHALWLPRLLRAMRAPSPRARRASTQCPTGAGRRALFAWQPSPGKPVCRSTLAWHRRAGDSGRDR